MAIIKKTTVTTTDIPAKNIGGVKVTDFTTGQSVTTKTDSSGRPVSRTVSGGGGRTVTPQQAQELVQATEQLEVSRVAPDQKSALQLAQRNAQIQVANQQQITDVQRSQQNQATAQAIRSEASRRGIDISTPARETSFINTLRREGQGKVSEPPLPPTREELLAEGRGGVFLTKSEAEAQGIKSVQIEGEKSASQRSIEYAEYISNVPIGSSGTVYVSGENTKPINLIDAYHILDTSISNKIPTFEEVSTTLPKARDIIVKKTSNPTLDYLRRLDAEAIAKQDAGKGALSKNNPFNQFLQGAGEGIYRDIQQKPLKNVAIFGVGAGLGGGLRLLGVGVKAVGGATALEVSEGAVGTFGFALGGAYLSKEIPEFIATPGAKAKGEFTGVRVKDLGVFALGFRAGQKGFEYAYDVYRTRGLTEVPTESVVAPEYFTGQRYPGVKPGTRAGALKKEFYNPVLPNESPGTPRGFSASAEPLAPSTAILPGTSEVPGLFSAPKVSPEFLRVAGESQGFNPDNFVTGQGLLYGGSPTATRLRFNNLDYTPGVRGRTRLPTGRYPIQFFENRRGTGETFIPGAKTEKEAITTADSNIFKVSQEYFFKFKGRRVVVPEYNIAEGSAKGKGTLKLSDVVAESSSSRIVSSRSLFPFSSSNFGFNSRSILSSRSSISSASFSSSFSSFRSSSPSSLRSSASSYFSSGSSSSSSYARYYRSSYSPGSSGSSYGRSSSSSRSKNGFNYRLPSSKQSASAGGYNVFVRRFGKFRPVGTGLSLNKAFNLGVGKTNFGLSQTFKITGGRLPGTPKGFYSKRERNNGIVFIELPKTKINTGSEKGLLNFSRLMKGGRR